MSNKGIDLNGHEIKFTVKDTDIPRIRAGKGVEFVFEKDKPTQADLLNLVNDLMAVLIKHGAYLNIKPEK